MPFCSVINNAKWHSAHFVVGHAHLHLCIWPVRWWNELGRSKAGDLWCRSRPQLSWGSAPATSCRNRKHRQDSSFIFYVFHSWGWQTLQCNHPSLLPTFLNAKPPVVSVSHRSPHRHRRAWWSTLSPCPPHRPNWKRKAPPRHKRTSKGPCLFTRLWAVNN